MTKNIVLVGFMATGKSTVGRNLAKRLRFEAVDTDDLIERRTGKTISRIFSEEGESAFRDQESEVAQKVSRLNGHVIITGGGIVLREENIKALKEAGPIFCLAASPEVVLKRTQGTDHRPLLQTEDPLEKVRGLLEVRGPFYARADHTIDTSDLTIEEVVDRIVAVIGEQYPEILQ
jgi:shikimate kinase